MKDAPMTFDLDWLIRAIGGALIMAFGAFVFRTEKRGAEHEIRLKHVENQLEDDRTATQNYRIEMRDVVTEVRQDIKKLLAKEN